MTATTTTVDLTNCDREPIHLLGAIQPIGFLIALTKDWIVRRASANVAEFIGESPERLIGRPISDIVQGKAVHDLRNRTALLRGQDGVERVFGVQLQEGGAAFDVGIHYSDTEIVIEGSPSEGDVGDVTSMVRSMMTRLDQCEEPAAFFREGARQVRALVGFDRVMVYRFAEDGSGEVVAEACNPGIGRFLGLRYPASDIPVQARILYTRNLLRVIADVEAEPVPIVPALDQAGKPLDLSLSLLRSVSPIHIEYLKNMGVRASLSISIVVDGKLWGLFACHHYSPRCPTLELRSITELFAQMFSMRLESRERQSVVEYERRARDVSDQLLGAIASDEAVLRDPDWLADMLSRAIPADGIGVWLGGNYAFAGSTPPTDAFRKIVRALNVTAAGKVFATDHIGGFVDGAEAFSDAAAGLLAIPVSRSPRDYVVLFRSELIRSVRWAGDPHKPVEYGPNGPRLSPRESFEEWKELVRGRSQPFTSSELRVAETLRTTLIEVVLRLSEEASSERREAGARQELLIAELNHRVRNILGLIRGLIRHSQPGDEKVQDFVSLIDGRIHALARAHNQITEDHWGPASLRALLEAESAAYHEGDRVKGIGDGVMINPTAYSTMALVLHELVTNSAKYGSLSAAEGVATLSWRRDTSGDLLISWRETGGPPVIEPDRQGFGTTIIQRSVPYDLGGSAVVRYTPTGLEADFCIPKRHVADHSKTLTEKVQFPKSDPGHREEPPADLLKGERVLLVEDSLIIALDAEDIVTRLGAENVITAASVDATLDMMAHTTPTIAVLDINLGNGTSFAIADQLLEQNIPFIFATGYGEQAVFPPQHMGRAVVQKPYTKGNIARALAQLKRDG